MLILEPQISVEWVDGVRMKVHTYLYLEGTTPPTRRGMPIDKEWSIQIQITISSNHTPEVSITPRYLLERIPGAIDAVNDWISTHNLMSTWEGELAAYNKVMDQVHLEDYEYTGGNESGYYKIPIEAPGTYDLSSMEVVVRVNKQGATAQLQLASEDRDRDDEEVEWSLCTYPLEYPITIDTIKASIRPIFHQYLSALWGLGYTSTHRNLLAQG